MRRGGADELVALLSSLILPLLWIIAIAPLLFTGIRAISRALVDPGILNALWFSLAQAILAAAIASALAIPLGYLNATYDYPGRSLIEVVTTAPFTMPTISVALAFLLIVRSGLLPAGLPAIALANAYFNFGFCSQMVTSSLLTVGKRLEEASEVLGASRLMKWRKIILPLALRGVSYGFILTFTLSFASFAVPLLLGGPGARTLEVEIYSLYKIYLDEKMASAAALLQLIVTFSVSMLLTRRTPSPRTMELRRRQSLPIRLFPILAYPYLLSIIAAYPMCYLLLKSLINPFTGKLAPQVYLKLISLEYDPILGVSPLRPLANSLFYALMTALIVLTISSLISLSPRARKLATILSMLPLGTSSITMALGLYIIASRIEIPGWIAIILSHVLIAFPFVIRSLESGVFGLSPSLMDAAETLGLSRLDALFKVAFPASLPAVLSATFYSFALSISETSASTLLAEPETSTLTVAALKYSGARKFQMASAISFTVMMLTWLFLWIKSELERRIPWLR